MMINGGILNTQDKVLYHYSVVSPKFKILVEIINQAAGKSRII
jgi:hypothetical protein